MKLRAKMRSALLPSAIMPASLAPKKRVMTWGSIQTKTQVMIIAMVMKPNDFVSTSLKASLSPFPT